MSTDDGNTELTSLLLELEQNLRAKPVSVDVKRVSSEAEWIAAFGEYVEKDPQIEFKGKIFVFDLHADSSFSVKEALYDRGGIIRQSVSSKTDYLVTRLAWYALATLRKAIELKKNGCKIKIVLQEDFDAAVNRTPIIAQEGYNVAEDGTLELRGETMIRSKAFRSNKELKMIRIPKGVTYINKNAFEGCENLKTVVLPKTLISIAEYAFWRCASLESVTFNERLRRIGRNAFQSCTSLESVTFNEGLEKIDDSAFQGCTSLESVTFNEGLRTIGMNAFQDCTSLESVTFNKGLRTIGMNAFQDCTSLESVTFNEGLSEIGSKAFQDCTSLKSVTFNKGLRRIGTLAFWDCTSLESITFNGGWETIDEHAFRGCELLKSVTMLVSEENPLTTWLKDVSPYNFSTSKVVLRIPKSLCGWAMENGIERKFDRIEYLS